MTDELKLFSSLILWPACFSKLSFKEGSLKADKPPWGYILQNRTLPNPFARVTASTGKCLFGIKLKRHHSHFKLKRFCCPWRFSMKSKQKVNPSIGCCSLQFHCNHFSQITCEHNSNRCNSGENNLLSYSKLIKQSALITPQECLL